MNIGERVKEARIRKGLTQEELAKLLGYKSKSSVAHIENGRDIPRTMVVKLAEILNTTPAYLMGWEDDPTDYENDEENLNAPLDVIEYFNGDAERIVKFQRAVAEDAMRSEPEDENLIILNRNAKKLSPENRKKLLDMARLMFKEEFEDDGDS